MTVLLFVLGVLPFVVGVAIPLSGYVKRAGDGAPG
jgi:hypothetical protein